MLKPAFSTVACPNWTMREVARHAEEWGYEGVELRTFGDDSRSFACDPALTDPAKTRAAYGERGLEILSLATSLSFDAPFAGPPVIGRALFDQDRSIREGGRAIDLASALGCPIVRVFGFKIPPREARPSAIARISDRLRLVLDHAHRTGVRIALENGGDFASVDDVTELLNACDSPLLGVCYSNAAAILANQSPIAGARALSSRIIMARVRDSRANAPCRLGEGELDARAFVQSIAASGLSIPMVFEHDNAWHADAAPPEMVLPLGASTMYQWIASADRGPERTASTGGARAGSRA